MMQFYSNENENSIPVPVGNRGQHRYSTRTCMRDQSNSNFYMYWAPDHVPLTLTL